MTRHGHPQRSVTPTEPRLHTPWRLPSAGAPAATHPSALPWPTSIDSRTCVPNLPNFANFACELCRGCENSLLLSTTTTCMPASSKRPSCSPRTRTMCATVGTPPTTPHPIVATCPLSRLHRHRRHWPTIQATKGKGLGALNHLGAVAGTLIGLL